MYTEAVQRHGKSQRYLNRRGRRDSSVGVVECGVNKGNGILVTDEHGVVIDSYRIEHRAV
jgi:hypothetical protein